MFVYQAMSSYVVAITPDEPATRAARDLIERDITGLPVVDEDGHVLGVVSELDLLRAMRNGVDLRRATVGAVMDRRPLFVGPETDLYTAIDLMEEWQVRRLPVCVGTRLVGILSRRDILATLIEHGRPQPALAWVK
jgi:CBS domain-containing protein